MQIDMTTNPTGVVSNTAGTIAFWPPEAITKTELSANNNEEVRGTEYTHDVDDLPPMDLEVLPPMRDSAEDLDLELDLDELPPMMESYNSSNMDLDSLPPMTMTDSHDWSDLVPAMDVDSLPPLSHSSERSSELPPMALNLPSLSDSSVLKYSSFGADIWAAGMTIHCLLFGVLPISIEGSNPVDIMDKIAEYKPPTDFSAFNNDEKKGNKSSARPEEGGQRYSTRPQSANEVWSSLLISDPLSRMTLSQSFEMEWLSKEASRREKMKKVI